ncbi:MAG: SPASM domain-containing protein [Paludibacteraceae bacterium]|nr:SPASM domain-containing protein [Paludibacteraceae bacterium]
MRHLPTFVSVEPANFCQLRCPACPVGMRGKEQSSVQNRLMSMDVFSTILDNVCISAHTMQFYFQGEPLLNRQLPDMISLAHQRGLYTIVSTNAQALTTTMAESLIDSGLNRIIVSIDGFSEASYAAYRVGGCLARALESLKLLQRAKKKKKSGICIELQVLRLRSNEHEWKWIREHYRELGATRLVFKTAQLYDYHHGHPLMPTQSRYSRYRLSGDGTYQIHRSWWQRHGWHTPCYRLWSGCVVTVAGRVLPCCYDKSSEYSFGELLSSSLAAIWHSERANAFRKTVLHHRNRLPICQECNQ